jgi:hypothetical protein
MSIRLGLTAQEENKLKHLVSQGKTWEQIAALNSGEDGKLPIFADVNLDHVKKSIYDPLVKKLEAAKKAGHRTIHEYEAKLRAEAKKTAKTDTE